MYPSDIARLRATVAILEREISHLPMANPPNDLVGAWRSLVEQLDVGPVPELRGCPVCKHTVMRAATLCGFCWTKLPPLASA